MRRENREVVIVGYDSPIFPLVIEGSGTSDRKRSCFKIASTSLFHDHLPILAFAGNVADRCCTDKYGFKVDLVDSLKRKLLSHISVAYISFNR